MSKVHEENECFQEQKVQSKGGSRPVKDNVVLLLEKLGLRLYYPYKLSLMQVITIREVEKHKSFTDIPWIFLENIIMLNSNARDGLIEKHLTCDKLQISSSDDWNLSEDADYTKKDLSNEIEIVNPLDLIVLLFRCCSPILSQVLAMKMFMCRLAVPFILPPYECDELALIFFRHLQLIIIEQNTENGSIQSSAIKCPCHVVSFVRIGELSVSKSKIANQVLSDQYHDTFFHKDCPLGTSKRQVSNGLVETAWDLITTESGNVTQYLNLRGDGLLWQGQLEILSRISSVLVIFLNVKHLHDPKSLEILNRLQSFVTGSVLAVDASSNTNDDAAKQCLKYLKNIGDLRKRTRICKLAVERTIENYSNIKREIERSIIETLRNDKVLPMKERVLRARTNFFSTDEDYPLFKNAEKKAFDLFALIPKRLVNMKENILPLQGRLWRNFTEKQKTNKKSTKYQSIYQKENIIEEMTKFREQQLHALRKQGPMMERFKKILLDKNLTDEECMIFITVLQHILNEQSRKVIPQFLQKYQKAWRDLKVARDSNGSDTRHLQKEFKDAEHSLAEASFGLEHLVRECGQGFEAIQWCKKRVSYYMIYQANMLSNTFARLLLHGLPLELMDGDAANVPLEWIRSVLNDVKEIIGNKKLFTVSVVGIQSSGKSTLLNAMFGLKFAVSAGRCTRGVYIQLVPVDNKSFDYLLIVDTEGLRAAELEHQKYDQDNRLATFAIGLADVTVVNIKGENTSEVADILQIAVHAFLRLKLVNNNFNLEQSCVFVHQNVPATDAKDKMMQGRQKFEETLDKMTKEAAKQEQITNIQFFNQVINFDSDKNVWYFSDLWVGDPPMAPTNPGYSKRASEVKQAIITKLSALRETFFTIDHIVTRIEDLWTGILTDDFVFCFRNSLELKAYSSLEKKYNELSWDLHKLFWEFSLNTVKVQLGNAVEEDELQKTANTLTNSLTPKATVKAKELEDYLNVFVDKHELKEVMLQWVKTKQLKLVILVDELITSTKSEIITLKEECKIKILQIKEKANHEIKINRRARKLASDLEGKQVKESIMKEQFENMWSDWFRNIETQIIQPLDTQSVTDKIKNTVWDMCPSITNYLNIEEISRNLTSLNGSLKPQNFEMGKHFEIHRPLDQNKPVHPGFRQRVMEITDVIFNKILLKVCEIERQDVKFNTKFVVDILCIIEEEIESHNNKNQSQILTFNLLPPYNALIISHIVRYITSVFTKHEEAYQKRHSIMGQLEEYKDTAWGLFISTVNKTTADITAAKCFRKVIISLVIEQVRSLIPNDIKDAIVKKFAHAKENTVYEIMKDLALKEKFEDIYSYILDPSSFVEKWLIDHAISIYFEKGNDGQHQYARIAEGYVRQICMEIREGIKEATATTCHDTIASWINNFCKSIYSLPTNKFHFVSITDMVDVDVVHFVKLISDQSDEIEERVLELIIQTNENNIVWPHHPIRDIMDSLWGCKSKCPFCFEPCINTDQNHCEMGRDHRCVQHRIKGLRGKNWSETRKLTLNYCNIDIQADRVAFRSGKKKEWTKYKDYKEVHPEWDIEPTSDTSDYWKWLVCRFKESFEKKHGKEFDEIPSSWKNISKEDAIDSLDTNLSDSS